MKQKVPSKTLEAVGEYSLRLRNAMRTFRASDDPLWKRTKEGLDWFGGLPMDNLPPRLMEEIEGRFATINAILASHSINTFEDYRNVPSGDLVEIQDLIEGFAFDEKPYRPGRKTTVPT
jgi:hypothetical protein